MCGKDFVVWFTVCVMVVTATDIILEAEEELSGRVYLGNIAEVASANGSEFDFNNAGYNILAGDYSSYFEIVPNSDFYQVKTIDREDICSQQESCYMGVDIGVTIGTKFVILKVKVMIKDINDNEPKFSRTEINLSISEGTFLGTSYELPSVTDLDSAEFSIQNFTLEPSDLGFELEAHQNLDGSFALNLILNLVLDRELKDTYRLTVQAVDGGSPPRTGNLQITVNVTDINDNSPVFEQQEYNTTIDEDIGINTIIETVVATDRDIGENGRLTYYFSDYDPVSAEDSFGIWETSGEIYVKGGLDSQTGPFTLYVKAKDHGVPFQKSLAAKVIINVKDKNDNPPEIRKTILNNGHVMENSDVGTPAAHISVIDADTGLNGEAVCVIENQNFSIHKISRNNFRVDVAVLFDRENIDRYDVLINCTDKGEPALSTTDSFTVIVEDENDNKPKFSSSLYSHNVTENNNQGAVILRVDASDLDIGLNGQIIYAIEPFAHSSKFIIEPTTGIIKARESLDREDMDNYTFTVSASDRGSKPLFDTASVIIRVLDLNDNAPEFIGDHYSMSVLENSNVSTSIGQVTATDADLGSNGMVSFIIPSNYSSFPFNILDDGTMVTTAVLNREDISNYEFEVIAADHGNPPQQTAIRVHVNVLDENDNPPYMEFPYGDNDTISVAHSTLPNEIITTIIAGDEDEKENRRLVYSIITGNDDGIFSIKKDTGEIFLQKQIFDGDIKIYTLTISVKDLGVPQLETRATLHVKFYVANETSVSGPFNVAKSQNILIAIIMSCVTFVLSVIIITIICIIRTKDRRKNLFNAKAYDEQKIMSSHRNSNRSSSSKGSGDRMLKKENIYTDNVYQLKKNKKEVSFSLEDDPDGGHKMEVNGQFDQVSTFKTPSPVPSQSTNYDQNYGHETPPPKPERSEDRKQREIHRMTSLRVHQALIQSHNNNNNNSKQWPQSPQEETNKAYIGLKQNHLDDSHSETSGETTTSDSGRGGSEEDIRSSMTNSHDTDDSRSPNTSSSHPFYTSESQQPTFSSFHGNSVHKSGPILSSFMNRPQRPGEDSYQNSYPLNDLSNPHRNNPKHRHASENNLSHMPKHINSALPYPNSFGKGPHKMDSDSYMRSDSKPSNLNLGHAYENENESNIGQDDDNTTTTSGSYTVNDLTEDMLNIEMKDMFYKPDTFV